MINANVEDLLTEQMITKAMRHIEQKKGSPGSDGILWHELSDYWKKHGNAIKKDICNGCYKPLPAKKILVRKPGKKERRGLEIPCMIDRMILYAIYSVLAPGYNPLFSNNSYGFRRGRGCSEALDACMEKINSGFEYVIDLDIKSFFDEVDHSVLLRSLQRNIQDQRLLNMIEGYIKWRVWYGNHTYIKRIGISQGSALSPLLANVYLDVLDRYIEKSNVPFVRYADDVVIFCASYDEAKKILNKVKVYLKEALHLRLNSEKTQIVSPEKLVYLGYGFKKKKNQYEFVISDKRKQKIKWDMEFLISKKAENPQEKLDRIGMFNRGWLNYYKKVNSENLKAFLSELEKREIKCIRDVIRNQMCGRSTDAYIEAVCASRSFVLPNEWERVLTEREGGK